jgi:hypothetical protein
MLPPIVSLLKLSERLLFGTILVLVAATDDGGDDDPLASDLTLVGGAGWGASDRAAQQLQRGA